MKRAAILLVLLCSIGSVPQAQAQYEGSDAKYAAERREERAKMRWFKYGAGGVAIAVGMGYGLWKKYRGA